MTKKIAVLNTKGGVGKTTLAIHLARALAMHGDSVLLLDADPQNSPRYWDKVAKKNGFDHGIDVRDAGEGWIPKLVNEANDYDWIIIDGPGSMTDSTLHAVMKAHLVLIPVQPSMLDLWATKSLVDLIKENQNTSPNGLPKAAFQVMRSKKGTRLEREINVVEDYGFHLMHGQIHDRTAFAVSIGNGSTVLDDDSSGLAAWEVNHMVQQITKAFKV